MQSVQKIFSNIKKLCNDKGSVHPEDIKPRMSADVVDGLKDSQAPGNSTS